MWWKIDKDSEDGVTRLLLCLGLCLIGGGHGHLVPEALDLVPLFQSRPLQWCRHSGVFLVFLRHATLKI